jgi:hypothetical protein
MNNPKSFTKPILNSIGLGVKVLFKYIVLIFLIILTLEVWKNIPESDFNFYVGIAFLPLLLFLIYLTINNLIKTFIPDLHKEDTHEEK